MKAYMRIKYKERSWEKIERKIRGKIREGRVCKMRKDKRVQEVLIRKEINK